MSDFSIKPMHNYICIEIEKPTEAIVGGLIVPENAPRGIATGFIRALGPDVPVTAGFKEGQHVLFPPFGAGYDYEPVRAGTIYKFLLETEILAVL